MKKILSSILLSSIVLFASSYRDRLEKEVSQIKKSLPKVLNKNVELSDVSLNLNDATYIYRLLSMDKAKASNAKLEQFKAQAKNLASMIVCSRETIREMVEKNIDIIYTYNDVNNKHLTTVKVTKQNCKKIDLIIDQINKKGK